MEIDSYVNKHNPLLCKIILALSDFLFFNLSFLLSLFFVFGDVHQFIYGKQIEVNVLAHFILSILCVGWFWVRLRHYSYRKPFWSELKEVIRTILIFSIFDLALIAFSQWQFSRSLWIFSWGFAIVLIPLFREIAKRILNHFGVWRKKTIILGSGPNAIEAYFALQSDEMMGFDVAAFYDDACSDMTLQGVPVLRRTNFIWEMIKKGDIHFVVAFETEDSDRTIEWLRELSKKGCRSVTVIPSLRGLPLYNTDMSFIFSQEVMLLRIHNNLAKRTSRFLKRAFDIILSLSIILISLPLLAYIWFRVTRDGGPAIYSHMRVGRQGKLFPCYKFRTMVMNSQEILQQLLDSDPVARAEWARDFKLKNDPRITPVGCFLRKTSLDELPQLFNVLKGQMSLVGPRPIISAELTRYDEDVDYYLMAKPGMSGLWQVSGRNDVDYETRVYFDAWYVKNWSLWNDIVILFKTVKVVLHRGGAY